MTKNMQLENENAEVLKNNEKVFEVAVDFTEKSGITVGASRGVEDWIVSMTGGTDNDPWMIKHRIGEFESREEAVEKVKEVVE